MISNSDHNLLFGIIALQMDFVRRDQLVAATITWLTDKSRKIDEILVEQGALGEADRQLLAPLVARHLENHGGDPEQSIAALSSIGSIADELRSLGDDNLKATLSLVASDHPSDSHEETVAHESTLSTFADAGVRDAADPRFRILRSHAKGGLGEVYVAKDTELNREVALKEIQTKYADDEASRLRFLLEAEVTGGLEHPGIVPVYGLGRYDDGRPFYAMRFIKGDSLQEAADRFHGRVDETSSADAVNSGQNSEPDFRSLQFRQLLGRFIDVCQAIEYAHSRGVLHRDLKPGNIMLGKYGETLVVDWGLAKAQGRDQGETLEGEATLRPASASGSAPTMMGSAIGTPAFMPPEQAAGDLDRLGPASDVYSLGATLYYLITGKPPFQGKDLAEVLGKVKSGNFSSPQAIQRHVPQALAAVCLKAMATRPSDRFVSPSDLADDVERFLADEPVSAFREPASVRVRRWVRKHQTVAATTAAALLLSAVGMIAFSFIVSGKNAQLSALNASLLGKNDELDQKNVALNAAVLREEKARELAAANAKAAREQSQLALSTLTAVVRDIQGGLRNVPGAAETRRNLLSTSLAELEAVATEHVQQTAVDYESASALIDMGLLVLEFGEDTTATPAEDASQQLADQRTSAVKTALLFLGRAREVGELLAEANAENLRARQTLARTYDALGRVQMRMGGSRDALKYYQMSLTIREKIVAEHPDLLTAKLGLSAAYDNVGNTELQLGGYQAALSLFQKDVELSKELAALEPDSNSRQSDLSLSYQNLGEAYFLLGENRRAIKHYEESLRVAAALAAKQPTNVARQRNLNVVYNKLGEAQLDARNPVAALASFQKAVNIGEALVASDPSNREHQRDLSISHELLGDAQLWMKDFDAALSSFERNRAICEELAAKDPGSAFARRDLASAYQRLGNVNLQSGNPRSALKHYQKSLEITQSETADDQANVMQRENLAISHQKIGDVQLKLGDTQRALEAYQQSLRVTESLVADDPSNMRRQDLVLVNYARIGLAQSQAGDLRMALSAYQKAIAIAKILVEKDPGNLRLKDHVWTLRGRLAETYLNLEDYDAAIKQLEASLVNLQSNREAADDPQVQKYFESRIVQYQAALRDWKLKQIAVGDWAALLRQPTKVQHAALVVRAFAMLEKSRYTEAAQAATRLCEAEKIEGGRLYNAACVFGRCVAAVQAEPGEELNPKDSAQRREWTEAAIATLKRAIDAGWDDFDQMRKDEDFKVLRSLPEFKALIPEPD